MDKHEFKGEPVRIDPNWPVWLLRVGVIVAVAIVLLFLLSRCVGTA